MTSRPQNQELRLKLGDRSLSTFAEVSDEKVVDAGWLWKSWNKGIFLSHLD